MATLQASRYVGKNDSAVALSRPASLPPVIVLNTYYSGLGIARDLAGHGVRVVGLSADRSVYGNFSRFCEVRLSPNSQEEPERLAEMLLDLSRELKDAVIFPTRDADVLFLDRFRSELTPHYHLAVPSHSCLMRVMDKYALTQSAQAADVPAPRTTMISSYEHLRNVEDQVGFPCVLKPVFAVNWRGSAAWNQVGARKAIRINSFEDLQREYATVSPVDPDVLVQEWIAGSAEHIVVLGGYFDRNSDLVDFFTARKLIQSPDDFGTGCVVESDNIPEIVTLSRRLGRELKYQGMAEIEYKYDQKSASFQLIEINTRHWDWHRLGSCSAINLTWTAYTSAIGRSEPREHRTIVRAKWIAEDAFFSYLLRALYRKKIRPREIWRKLSGPRIYGIFAWNDPVPALRFWFSVILPELTRAIFSRLREGQSS
ncbi:MAG TPA: hypothetical protein VND65_16380 [Candidatus Binatia bacterium]|nr:hypothetical protein [Candidatus Binatia bacterium]